MYILLIIGRILFGGIMLMGGSAHFTKLTEMTKEAQSKKLPLPKIAVMGTGLLLLAGGASLVLWVYPVWGTSLLLAFFIPTTFIMHAFWSEKPENRTAQFHGFTGNMSIIGLLLILLYFLSA